MSDRLKHRSPKESTNLSCELVQVRPAYASAVVQTAARRLKANKLTLTTVGILVHAGKSRETPSMTVKGAR